MKKRIIKLLAAALLIIALIIPSAVISAAPEYEFTILDYVSPQGETAYSTAIMGINARGDVVGQFSWQKGLPFHGFLMSNGEWTVLDYPDGVSTSPTHVGPSGAVVGYYLDTTYKSHGFIWTEDSGFSPVNYPGYMQTQLCGIGPDGTLYGVAWNSTTPAGGWVDSLGFVILPNGEPLDAAEIDFTALTRASSDGKIIAGMYRDASGNPPNKACIIEDGIRAPLTLSGLNAVYSAAWGISPSGNTVVGIYGWDLANANTYHGHSFIGERKGKGKEWQFTDFALPDAAIVATRTFGINAGGVLVGACNYAYDGTNPASYAWHGFIAKRTGAE